MKVRFHASGCTHPGHVRIKNDDSFSVGPLVEQEGSVSLEIEENSRFFQEFGLLLMVADGMGGYEGGALASKTVLETLTAHFYAQKHQGMTGGEVVACIQKDLENTKRVLGLTLQRENLPDGGTTLAGLVLMPPDVAVVFHCGDSRVLRACGGYVRALTVDHAPLAAEVAAGHLDAAVALASPVATKLSRALGIRGDSRVELNSDLAWATGDRFLICSDGFHGLGRGLPLAALRERLRDFEENEVRNPAEILVNQAVEADGRDNATLVQVSISTGP